MDNIIPDSPSVILRSTHVLAVVILTSKIGEWQPHPEYGQQRLSEIILKIEEVLKGETDVQPGDSVKIRISQFKSKSLFILPLPGVWSGKKLDPGTRLLVFCTYRGTAIKEILKEVSCIEIHSREDYMPSVSLVLKLENKLISLNELLIKANQEATFLNYLFAEYLGEQITVKVIETRDTFNNLVQLLENKDLPSTVRLHLIDTIEMIISDANVGIIWQKERFIVSLFRLLEIDADKSIHDEIIGTTLPELINLRNTNNIKKAEDVFSKNPGERKKALQNLINYKGEISTEQLMEWIK